MNLVRALKGMWSILFTYTPLYFYSSPLDQEFAWKAPRPDGVEYEWVSEANVDKIQVWKGALGARRFRMWLNRGDLGTFALIDGEVVAYTWCLIKLSPWTLSCLHEPVEVGDAYHGRGETKKGFRRRGINSYTRVRLQRYLRQHYQDKGVKRMCGTTVTEGAMIVGSIEKQGYVKSQEMILVRLLYFVFILCTWDLLPNGNKKRPGRLSIKFRIPEVFWDPILVAARKKVMSWLDVQLPSDR